MKKLLRWAKKYGMAIGMIALCLCALSITVLANTVDLSSKPPTESEPAQDSVSVDSLLAEVNTRRTEAGVPPLAIDPRINSSAQAKADDMKAGNYFDHTSPTGKHGYEILYEYMPKEEVGYVSENLQGLCARYDTKKVVDEWFASEKHKQAMLDARYTLTGFGIVADTSSPTDEFCNGVVVEHFVEARKHSLGVQSDTSVRSNCTTDTIKRSVTQREASWLAKGKTETWQGLDGYKTYCNGKLVSEIKPVDDVLNVGTYSPPSYEYVPSQPVEQQEPVNRDAEIAACIRRVQQLSPGSNAYMQCH